MGNLFLCFLFVFFQAFGIVGFILGIGLYFFPDRVWKLCYFLTQPVIKDNENRLEKSLEHIFFNHHILTGIGLILFPVLLIVLLPNLSSKNTINESMTWVPFYKEVIIPSIIFILRGVSLFSIISGLTLLTFPQYFFRVLRFLNKRLFFPQAKNFSKKNPKITGFCISSFSFVLLFLLNRI